MAEVINLNRKRKAKSRIENEKKASQNRIKYGRTKQEKTIEKRNAKRVESHLEGHKLDTEENE
jgi:hypothetical protein